MLPNSLTPLAHGLFQVVHSWLGWLGRRFGTIHLNYQCLCNYVTARIYFVSGRNSPQSMFLVSFWGSSSHPTNCMFIHPFISPLCTSNPSPPSSIYLQLGTTRFLLKIEKPKKTLGKFYSKDYANKRPRENKLWQSVKEQIKFSFELALSCSPNILCNTRKRAERWLAQGEPDWSPGRNTTQGPAAQPGHPTTTQHLPGLGRLSGHHHLEMMSVLEWW